MRIIGAGLPRTATLTQKVALEMLGIGPCYHMVTVLGDLSRVEHWLRALAGDACWDDILQGFTSTVDWPGAFFYRELMDVYPESKVLLSVRDPDRWAASMHGTVLAANRGDNLMRHLSKARSFVDAEWRGYNEMTSTMLYSERGFIGAGPDDPATLAELFRRYIDEVKATVPPGRLLVWEAADGWEPLCDFVGAAVPPRPLPRLNDSTMFEDRVIEGSLAALNQYWDERKPH